MSGDNALTVFFPEAAIASYAAAAGEEKRPVAPQVIPVEAAGRAVDLYFASLFEIVMQPIGSEAAGDALDGYPEVSHPGWRRRDRVSPDGRSAVDHEVQSDKLPGFELAGLPALWTKDEGLHVVRLLNDAATDQRVTSADAVGSAGGRERNEGVHHLAPIKGPRMPAGLRSIQEEPQASMIDNIDQASSDMTAR
ncbi:hypothetical protein [Mesorhizobium sp. B2-6-3]|uniref:hypothetical protein n=1 Tax=Mesorhizobium sp. B2-6-3 TaxID=2589914 RepID=UPI0015E3CFFC|nr:hypothetical protein [Mesorhizobium sp. B2-6-3]